MDLNEMSMQPYRQVDVNGLVSVYTHLPPGLSRSRERKEKKRKKKKRDCVLFDFVDQVEGSLI